MIKLENVCLFEKRVHLGARSYSTSFVNYKTKLACAHSPTMTSADDLRAGVKSQDNENWNERCSTHQPLLMVGKELKVESQPGFKIILLLEKGSNLRAKFVHTNWSKIINQSSHPNKRVLCFLQELRFSFFFGVCLRSLFDWGQLQIRHRGIFSMKNQLFIFGCWTIWKERRKSLKVHFWKKPKKKLVLSQIIKKILLAVLGFRSYR